MSVVRERNPSNLKMHIKREHEESIQKEFKCPFCEKTYIYKCDLTKHVKSIHEGLRFTCSKCDKEYRHRGSLKDHVAWCHKNIRQQCKHCEKTFSHRSTLQIHVKSVHEGRRYPCSNCDRVYKHPNELYMHKRAVHEKIGVPCTFCNKTFVRKDNLGAHIKNTHQKTEQKNYKTITENCDIVDDSGGNPLKCDNCDRKFKMRIAWKKHAAKCSSQTIPKEITEESHASQCDLCDFTTNDLQKLYRHSVETHMTATD